FNPLALVRTFLGCAETVAQRDRRQKAPARDPASHGHVPRAVDSPPKSSFASVLHLGAGRQCKPLKLKKMAQSTRFLPDPPSVSPVGAKKRGLWPDFEEETHVRRRTDGERQSRHR